MDNYVIANAIFLEASNCAKSTKFNLPSNLRQNNYRGNNFNERPLEIF